MGFTQSSTVYRKVLLVWGMVLCILAPISESKDAVTPTRRLTSENEPRQRIKLGSIDTTTGFQLELELDSLGAGIRTGTLNDPDSLYNDEDKPLVIFSPIQQDRRPEILMMANSAVWDDLGLRLPLDQLSWKSFGVESADDGSQTTRFEAIVKDFDSDEPVLRLVKVYKISQQSNVVDCEITLHNLETSEQTVSLRLFVPGGLNKLSIGPDLRRLMACFINPIGTVTDIALAKRDLIKAPFGYEIRMPGWQLLWIAGTNQHYTAILVPVPDEGKAYCDWINNITGWYYGPDGDSEANNDDGALGIQLRITPYRLAQSGEASSSKTYRFKLYIGPKDKDLFQGNEFFRDLEFVRVVGLFHRPANVILTTIACALVIGLVALVAIKKRSRLAAYWSKSGVEVAVNLRPAGFWIRVVAFIIDGLVFAPFIILHFLNILSIKSSFLLLCIHSPQFLYQPFMHSFYGATLGKMACGLKVIDSNGQKLTLRAAYLRFLPMLIPYLMTITSLLILFAAPGFISASTMSELNQLRQEDFLQPISIILSCFMHVDCVFVAFTPRKRAIHDMMAGSFCVYIERRQTQEFRYAH